MNGTFLRRTAIFTTVAGLGLLLAWMLGGRRAGAERSKPTIGVVDVPPGTDLVVASGLADISLVRAEKLVVAPVHEVTLDDGTKVPFRSMVLRGDSEHPLPSPRRDVRRAFLTNPDLQLLPVPKTRQEYEAASDAEPTTIRSIEGILDSGPGEAMSLRFKGAVKARSVRDGAPWDFAGEEATSDVQARTLHAPGAVSLASKDLHVEGRDLDAAEDARTVLLAGGADGSVASSRGVRIAGGAPGGATRFRCSGNFRILPLPAPGGAAGRIERWRLVLDQDARLAQDDGDLSARHIEADISRRKGDADSDTVVDEIRADGNAVLTGRGEGRDLRATGAKLLAKPQAKGNTDVWLDGSPAVLARETRAGREIRTLDVRGDGTARLSFPTDDGPVSSDFRGGATAVMTEPPEAPGEAPRRRDLRASSLSLSGMRAGGGTTRIESLVADGQALLHDGDRIARARRIEFRPLDGGASRTVLAGDVLFTWPAAGAMDPVAVLAPAADRPPAKDQAGGTMLLSSPGRAVIEQPPDGDTATGTRMTVEGGTMLRRVAGEQEVYRLTCSSLEARTPPGSKGIDALRATGTVRLAGREERPGGRRYELRGEGLDVRGAQGSDGARTADVEGAPEGTALAAFTGEDGRPFSVTGRTLHFDRASGAFRAEGLVRGSGILPERHGGGPGQPAPAGGTADLACNVLDGVLSRGGTEGSTKVTSLDARDDVWVRTETEFASGDHLVYDAARGSLLLHGDPARVTARSRGAPAALDLQDRCEAAQLDLSLADGRLEEARSATGGLLVRHRPPDAGAGKDAPPVQRVEARCRGPLSYRPAETRLQGDVRLFLSDLKDGAFVEQDRLEDADEVTIFHPPAGKEAGRVDRATAVSAAGRIEITSAGAGWKATGVARADMDVAAGRVAMESSAGAPRFRMENADGVNSFRRAVYDYRRNVMVESVGASVESGK